MGRHVDICSVYYSICIYKCFTVCFCENHMCGYCRVTGNLTCSLGPRSDFLVPDYLSQVQEEEEALGVQYELEETQHHPVYPGSTSASTTTPASSSSSVQMPVISQVSSSTQNCESSSGFLSPEPLDPLEAPASPKMDADDTAPMTEETKMDNSVGGSSPEVFEEEQQQQQHAQAKEVASITIK